MLVCKYIFIYLQITKKYIINAYLTEHNFNNIGFEVE